MKTEKKLRLETPFVLIGVYTFLAGQSHPGTKFMSFVAISLPFPPLFATVRHYSRPFAIRVFQTPFLESDSKMFVNSEETVQYTL